MDGKISHPQQNHISKTAGNMALIRALEFLKPPNKRLFCDPYARQFVPAFQRALLGPARLPAIRALLEDYFDWRAPGARTSGAARTRLIDDWVREALAAGVGQVVILGSGFDCRALRMRELANMPVFEVDRAAMIARKERVLGGSDLKPSHIRRIGVDFFARDASLGSRIVFTYIHAGVLDGSFATPGIGRLNAALRAYREPWTFGFQPEEVPAYLVKKGIRLLIDLGAAEYRRK
jgi:O-methyltransferase involved in polyketide biosynthesis